MPCGWRTSRTPRCSAVISKGAGCPDEAAGAGTGEPEIAAIVEDCMDLLFLTARVVHMVLGVFWVGTLMFSALFLLPAIRDAGPDGAKVAAGLMRRRFLDVLPAAAAVTVLSGFWLYWRVSAGFSSGYMGSSPGMAYGLGGLAAVLALGLGVWPGARKPDSHCPSLADACRSSGQTRGGAACRSDNRHGGWTLRLRARATVT